MNKWHLRFLRLAYFGLISILPIYALADYNATQGSGTIFRAFDATHGGTALCAAATTECQAVGLVNSAGAEIGTAGAPVRVDPTGTTTQPVSLTSTTITGTVAATQSGAWTVNPTTAANWGIGTSTQNSASVANGTMILGQFNTAPTTITTGNMSPLQMDNAGNVLVNVKAGGAGGGIVTPGATSSTLTAYTSAFTTTQNIFTSGGWPAVLVQLNQTTTLTGGQITFQGTYDGSNWITVPVAQVVNPTTFAPLTNPYTMVPSTNQPFLILTQGFQGVRILNNSVLVGSGSATPFFTLLSTNPIESALNNPLSSGSAIIGKVGIDQTTPGTTNAVAPVAAPLGGATPTSAIAPATPAGVNLKVGATTVYSIQATTIQATPVYLKLYDSASAPTCGSGTPVGRFMVPAAATAANGAGTNIALPVGIAFSSGLGYCVTGGLADADTTTITASNTLINIDWK